MPAQTESAPARVEWFVPAVDVYDNPERLQIVADLPGVSRDQLELRVERRTLLVEGRRADAPVGFRRTFNLPDAFDAEQVTAELANGVLTLTLPRAQSAKPRRIVIDG